MSKICIYCFSCAGYKPAQTCFVRIFSNNSNAFQRRSREDEEIIAVQKQNI